MYAIPWGRVIFAISAFTVLGLMAGTGGLMLAFLLIVLLGFVLPPPTTTMRAPTPPPPVDADGLTEARRGTSTDPTRPNPEDWLGLIENLRRKA
jgi:hypothetical protein